MTNVRTILIVEDNPMNRDMLSRRLAKRGYRILTAEDGKSGVDIAIEQQPDMILMDINLPIMDGLEATRTLKNDPATKSIPIIGLTAHARVEDRDDAIKSGCDEYESKPVEFDRLIEKIETLFSLKKES